MTAKNRYEFKWYSFAELIAIMPLALSAFPIPLAVPIALIAMCIKQPEEIPLAIIFFCWLVFGCLFIFYMERKYP